LFPHFPLSWKHMETCFLPPFSPLRWKHMEKCFL
jgi:hypothetical protein